MSSPKVYSVRAKRILTVGELVIEVDMSDTVLRKLLSSYGARYNRIYKAFLMEQDALLDFCEDVESSGEYVNIDGPPAVMGRIEDVRKERELSETLKTCPVPKDEAIYKPRFPHQVRMEMICEQFDRYFFPYDMGLGKTRGMLHVLERLKAEGSTPALVICPLEVMGIAGPWVEDSEDFTPTLKIQRVWDRTREKRKRLLMDPADVYLINYDGFKMLETELVKMRFPTVIIDESDVMGNPGSKITRAIQRYSVKPFVKHLYLLCGLPTPNHEFELIPQMYCIDPTILGASYNRAQERWGTKTPKKIGSRHFNEWGISSEQRAAMLRRVRRRAFYVSKDDAKLDLPERIFQTRTFQMEPAQAKAYKEMLRDCITLVEKSPDDLEKLKEQLDELKDDDESSETMVVIGANILAQLMRLRQITSGWVRAADDEGDYKWVWDGKIKVLNQYLHQIPNEQVIIWAVFRADIARIKEELGDDAEVIHGGVNPVRRGEILKRFKAGHFKYLIAHPRCLGHGINLTNACYAIYFSIDYSYRFLRQSMERIHRPGQEKPCTYVTIIGEHPTMKETIDHLLRGTMRRKRSMSDTVLAALGPLWKRR